MPDIFAAPAPLQDCNGIIDPSVFPIPTLDHVEFKNQASALRRAGEALARTGDDIVTSWGGLAECYSAPESDVLFSALDPVSADGTEVESAMDRAATALDTFADAVQEIKGEWFTLKTTAESFRESVVNDPDWDKANHIFTTTSDNVDKSNELRDKAERLIARYESAQRTCANALNADLLGRTHFSSAFEAEMDTTLNNPFVYDSVNMYVDAPSAWGAGASADLFWHQDALHAVGDFGMGFVEGAGGMLGAHSAAGWFEQSWGGLAQGVPLGQRDRGGLSGGDVRR